MLDRTRRRQHLGPYASAALPIAWTELLKRGWSHARLAEELEEHSGRVARMLYGDRRPGRDLAVKLNRVLGIAFELWTEPCPKGWRPHRSQTAPPPPSKRTGTDG